MPNVKQEGPGLKPGSFPTQKKLVVHGYWWWSLPALAAILFIHYIATSVGLLYSFTNYEGIGEFQWTGLKNYERILEDPDVMSSISNTFFLAFGSFILTNLIGLLLALALNRGLKTRYLLRTLLFLPVILSTIAVSYIFRFIFYVEGPVNSILGAFGLEELQKTWLADGEWSIWVILLVVVWQHIGFPMVIYLAGLATVPQELEEAAAIDGAGVWRRFFSVTVPMLQPAIAIATTLGIIQGMKIFDQVIAMTGGGPFGATETLSTTIYKKTFELMQYGYGSSIAMVFTVVILIFALLQSYLTRDRSGANK